MIISHLIKFCHCFSYKLLFYSVSFQLKDNMIHLETFSTIEINDEV